MLKSTLATSLSSVLYEKLDQIPNILLRPNADNIIFSDFWIEQYAKHDHVVFDTKCIVWLN